MSELLIIAIAWFAYLILFVNVGSIIEKLLGVNSLEGRPLFGTLLKVLLGMSVITAVFAVISFWFPIDIHAGAVVLAVALLLFLHRSVRSSWQLALSGFASLSLPIKCFSVLVLLIVLLSSWLPTLNYDTGLYHNQFIKWINTFPVIPGLANLHGRFGFNSHWHLLEAGLNGFPVLVRPLNDLGSFITVLLLFASIEALHYLIKKEDLFADQLMVMFFFPLYLLCRFFTSDTPDLPNAIIGFTVLVIPFHFLKNSKSLVFYVTAIGGFLATIKITAVFGLLVAFPAFLKLKIRSKLIAVLLGLLLVSPWLIRNYIQTGYLVFPAKITAMNAPDYQVPETHMDYMNVLLEVHGQFGRYAVEMFDVGFDQWLVRWFNFQTRFVQVILVFCPIMLLLLFLRDLYMIRKKCFDEVATHLMVHMITLLTLAVWFTKGPNPRYIYGVFIFYFVYALLRAGIERFRYAQLGFVALGFVLLLKMSNTIKNEPSIEIRSTDYEYMDAGAISIPFPSEHDQCWNHELPCASKLVIGLEMRGENLSDGFRIRNID